MEYFKNSGLVIQASLVISPLPFTSLLAPLSIFTCACAYHSIFPCIQDCLAIAHSYHPPVIMDDMRMLKEPWWRPSQYQTPETKIILSSLPILTSLTSQVTPSSFHHQLQDITSINLFLCTRDLLVIPLCSLIYYTSPSSPYPWHSPFPSSSAYILLVIEVLICWGMPCVVKQHCMNILYICIYIIIL